MSSFKDKKAALLHKIQRQKERQKHQLYSIPTIKLSTSDKKRKASKTFVPTIHTLTKKSKAKDSMREFLAEVNGLNENDFDIPPGGYINPIVLSGYKLYTSTYIKDAISAEGLSGNPDLSEIRNKSEFNWLNLPLYSKIIWVIQGYGSKKDAEWGRKKFTDFIQMTLNSEEDLRKFIDTYLERDIAYEKFITFWNNTAKSGTSKISKEEKEEKELFELPAQNVRLAVTKDEQDRIDDMKQRLAGYEEALVQLQENISTAEDFLSDQTHEHLVEFATPIMSRKTKDELISVILGAEFTPIKREKSKELFGEKWSIFVETGEYMSDEEKLARSIPEFSKEKEKYNDFLKELDVDINNRRAELNELSHQDLVLEATMNKTSPSLVYLLIYDEFHKNSVNLKKKIADLSLEIHNLSLGRYMPRTKAVKNLKYKEGVYRDVLLLHIRKLELETMSVEQLRIRAGILNAMPKYTVSSGVQKVGSIDNLDASGLISLILSIEFPNTNIRAPLPKVNYGEMKSVLETLTDDQIHVLAYANGVSNPEKIGKYRNIEIILRVEFPTYKSKAKKISSLVEGRDVKNWERSKREKELDLMSSAELRNEAVIIGIDIPKGTSDDILKQRILDWEEHMAKLIPKEDAEKDKLIKKITTLTGANENRYRLWSVEELSQRLQALREENQEYWDELEQERLYNKLVQIIDVKDPKYSDAKTWSLKKLRKELEKISGTEWETYEPLIENTEFTSCIEKYKSYDWIEGKVTGVWLSSVDGTIPSLEYVSDEIGISEDGHRWYLANKKYFALQCNKYKNKRVQKGRVFKCYTQSGKPVKFLVGYTVIGYHYTNKKYNARTRMVKTDDGRTVQRTFIIQNKALFNQEKQYDRRSQRTETETINDILNSTVTERTSDIVRNIISRALLDIAPMKKDYGVVHFNEKEKQNWEQQGGKITLGKSIDSNTPYMQILMNTLRDNPEQTNRELFTRAANIVVYLGMPEAKTFIRNVEKEYYLPEILATLSPTEKFPEVYQDPKISGKFLEDITASIDNKIYKFVYNLGYTEYKNIDPTARVYTKPGSIDYSRSIKTNKRISACENKNNVDGIPETEIVYYKDGDKIYCFSVDELYERIIISNNITNPETNKEFDIAFVKRFGQLYNKRLSEDGLLNKYFQKKYGFDMREMVEEKEIQDTMRHDIAINATEFWEKVGSDIAELEDQLSNEEPQEGDLIDENREEERREVEVEEGVRESVDIDKDDACVYCKKHLSDDSIKSLIMHNDESRIIKFCSFKCFENKNDWNKYKIKKAKKAKKAKKKLAKIYKAKKPKESKESKDDTKPVKLSREEIKKRRKIIKQKIKDGVAAFDKVAFPLMSKAELRELAKEKGIQVPGNLSKMGTASYLYKKLHPKSTTGVLKEKTAAKEMTKIETRRDKKKRKKKAKAKEAKEAKKSK